MARARNIKPAFFKNEELVELAFEVRLLFIGLWTLADREGRLEDRPKRIKMELFPADNVDVESGLKDLENSGFIVRYESHGVKVVSVLNFHRHQSPHHTEKASELPEANESDTGDSPLNNESRTGESQNDFGENPPDSLNPDSLNPDSLNPDSCAEPPSDSTPEAVISIPLSDSSEYEVTAEQVAEWKATFPAVDVMQALRNMRAWCIAQPQRQKTRRGALKFITGWLTRDQSETSGKQKPPTAHSGFERLDYAAGINADGSF